MVYIPDPTDVTMPTLPIAAGTAAAEFRALKAYIQTVLATAGIGGLNIYRKNILHNGDMSVDQRYEGNANPNAIFFAGSAYAIDRWYALGVGGGAGQMFTQRLPSTLGAGSSFMLDYHINIATVGNVADNYTICQGIEGVDAAQLLWGTALAKAVSLSFLVSSPVTGVHTVAIQNFDKSRSYITSFIIPVANTPTYITINNIPGDQAGVWHTDNTLSIILAFDTGSGANFQGVVGWQAGNKSTIAGATKPTSLAGHFQLSSVQLEPGAAASLFEVTPAAITKTICKRFFTKSYQEGSWYNVASVDLNDAVTTMDPGAATGIWWKQRFPVSLRAIPTVILYDINASANVPGFKVVYNNAVPSWTFSYHLFTPSAANGSGDGFGFGKDGITAFYNTSSTAGCILGFCYYANADFF